MIVILLSVKVREGNTLGSTAILNFARQCPEVPFIGCNQMARVKQKNISRDLEQTDRIVKPVNEAVYVSETMHTTQYGVAYGVMSV